MMITLRSGMLNRSEFELPGIVERFIDIGGAKRVQKLQGRDYLTYTDTTEKR